MTTYSDIRQKRVKLSDVPEDLLKKVRRNASLKTGGSGNDGLIHLHPADNEKRARREIANSNERRRMQSINSGFETLKTLLPTDEGEKMSKAAILQLTSKYIQHLVTENRRMRDQLTQLQQRQEPLASTEVASRKRKLDNTGLHPTSTPGVYVGYFQTLPQQVNPRPSLQATQLAVKPDYEQFVVEPPAPNPPPAQAAPQSKRLEHLVMAIEQIEGAKLGDGQRMVSPFTQLGSNDSLVDDACRPRSIPHKYLHRPQVVQANSSN